MMKFLKRLQRSLTTERIVINDLDKIIRNLSNNDIGDTDIVALLKSTRKSLEEIDIKNHGPLL